MDNNQASDHADDIRTPLDPAGGIVYQTDATGHFTDINAATGNPMGYPREALIGVHYLDLIRPDARRAVARFYRRQFIRRIPTTYHEFPILTADGEERWVGQNVRLIVRDDRLVGCQAIVRDLTAYRRAEPTPAERTHRLEVIRSVAAEMTRELDLDRLLGLIVRRAIELLDAPSGSALLWDEAAGALIPRAWHGFEASIGRLRFLPGQGAAGTVAATRRGLIVDNYPASPYNQRVIAEHARVHNLIAEPLLYRDQLLGVILVNHDVPERRFSEADRDLLSLFADQAAIAIENARLYQAQEQRLARLRELTRLNQVISSSLDLQTVLVEIARSAAELMDVPLVTFWLHDPADRSLRLGGVSHPEIAESLPAPRIAIGERGVGWVAAHREPLNVADMGTDSRFVAREWWERRHLSSFLGLPVVLDGDLLAVLALYGRQPFRCAADREILEAFAAQAAQAIRNASIDAERRRAETQLADRYHEAEQARAESRAVFDATGEAMVLISPERRVLTVNRRFEEYFGFPASAIVGRSIDELETDLRPIFADPDHAWPLIAGTADDPELHFTQVIGQRWPAHRELEVSSAPVHGPNGTHLGRLHVARDVTRERAADRLKTEFVSLVSHELRTPLTSIKGYVELLRDGAVGDLTPDQHEFLQVVQQNADRLIHLINNLLDVSRIESGNVEIQPVEVDFTEILDRAVAAIRPSLDAKEQTLTVTTAGDLPLVRGDPDRLVQIVTSLLSNAHKYTGRGGRIAIAAEAAGDRIEVAMTDTGIGLTTEEQASLFTKFFRAGNRTTAEAGGTGLGLTIARSLIELHGGTLTVSSAPNRGSTFVFTLPVAGSARLQARRRGAGAGPPARLGENSDG